MTLRARLLSKFADWAISRNPPGGYAGEDDERWAYTIVGEDGSPYLTRVLLTRTFALAWLKRLTGLGVYLHHFHRSDGDQHLHDHPWKLGASLILNGAYVEERVEQIVDAYERVGGVVGAGADEWHGFKKVKKVLTDTKVVRWFNYLTGDDFHAVRSLKGDVWTLFCTRGRFQDWGFLVDGVKVPWREYLSGLDTASGEKLDAIGKKYFVKRIVNEVWAWNFAPRTETDDEYRERIRAAMRAEGAKETQKGNE